MKRFRERSGRLFPRDGRIIRHELIDSLSGFEVIEEPIEWYSRALKDGRAAENVTRDGNFPDRRFHTNLTLNGDRGFASRGEHSRNGGKAVHRSLLHRPKSRP